MTAGSPSKYLSTFESFAFDSKTRYSQYIQHNPFAEPGREFAINFLADSFANPSTTATKIKFFAGQGYGMAHFKLTLPTITFAVVDYFRFKGTCIVEHWDVLQEITGTEPNPIAFF